MPDPLTHLMSMFLSNTKSQCDLFSTVCEVCMGCEVCRDEVCEVLIQECVCVRC